MRLIWKRWMVGRYTRSLEAEVARLRAENRALLNSILGIAGIPPLPAEIADATDLGRGSKEEQAAAGSGLDKAGVGRPERIQRANAGQRLSAAGVPFRRRSWYQVTRALEIDAARKKAAEAAAGPELGVAVKTS